MTGTTKRGAAVWVACAIAALAAAAPAGATTAAEALSITNALRAQSGLHKLKHSAKLTEGCANHARYMELNDSYGHGEKPGNPGYTESGAKPSPAAEIISRDPWRGGQTPWSDGSPFHMYVLMSPYFTHAGYGESGGFVCMRFAGLRKMPRSPKLYSLPANGARGVPVSESIWEFPYSPLYFLGLPERTLTGPSILILSHGYVERFGNDLRARSFSIVGSSGAAVKSKLVVAGTKRGRLRAGMLNGGGAVLLPMKPLSPGTTYKATVRWINGRGVKRTQKVTFTTAG